MRAAGRDGECSNALPMLRCYIVPSTGQPNRAVRQPPAQARGRHRAIRARWHARNEATLAVCCLRPVAGTGNDCDWGALPRLPARFLLGLLTGKRQACGGVLMYSSIQDPPRGQPTHTHTRNRPEGTETDNPTGPGLTPSQARTYRQQTPRQTHDRNTAGSATPPEHSPLPAGTGGIASG